MYGFKAIIELIGVNPFVSVPPSILQDLFRDSGRERGAIPIRGTVNGEAYRQTLVRYAGAWRLYINTSMLKGSPRRIGEEIALAVAFDPEDRTPPPPRAMLAALRANPRAKLVYDGLPPSRQKELARYIGSLKSEASVERNVKRMLDFLLGQGRFVGRDRP